MGEDGASEGDAGGEGEVATSKNINKNYIFYIVYVFLCLYKFLLCLDPCVCYICTTNVVGTFST